MTVKNQHRSAYTLLELLAVAVILAIISVYIIPRMTASSGTAKTNVNERNKAAINSAVERYTALYGEQPATIDELDTPDIFPDGIPVNPVNGLPYSLDPVTKRVDDGS
jgi:prepilin-type N-terminal cleavage/methylation domain-containing protein